eukprot:5260721-Prymnesium_polylepis.1
MHVGCLKAESGSFWDGGQRLELRGGRYCPAPTGDTRVGRHPPRVDIRPVTPPRQRHLTHQPPPPDENRDPRSDLAPRIRGTDLLVTEVGGTSHAA